MISLDRCKVVKNLQLPGPELRNRLQFVAIMTQAVAEDLGAKWLVFEKGGGVRGGFSKIGLEADFENAIVKHKVDRVSTVQLIGTKVHKFFAFRVGDGKRKPRRVLVSFQVDYAGSPYELEDHLLKTGRGEGSVEINAPEQRSLPGTNLAEPNEHGVFEGVKPVTRYKCNDKQFSAAISVVESAKGWHYGHQVMCGKQSDVSPLSTANVAISEALAIAEAAKCVVALAQKVIENGPKQHKKMAGDVADWAHGFMSQQGELIESKAD